MAGHLRRRSRVGRTRCESRQLESEREIVFMADLPQRKKYVIIGAGMHGLSTAWHLAKELKARGKGSGADIVVLDKTGPGAGASGIACGVIRNFYFQPAMG